MDGLLDVLRQDKHYHGGIARLILLALFELLGEPAITKSKEQKKKEKAAVGKKAAKATEAKEKDKTRPKKKEAKLKAHAPVEPAAGKRGKTRKQSVKKAPKK